MIKILLQRTPDLQEANDAYRQAQEKLRSAIKFKKTDVALFIALGESFASQAERSNADPALQQQVLHLHINQYHYCAINDFFSNVRMSMSCFELLQKHLYYMSSLRYIARILIFRRLPLEELEYYHTVCTVVKLDTPFLGFITSSCSC